MTLSGTQQLRRDLLIKALEVFRDTEAAMKATEALERFVLAAAPNQGKDCGPTNWPVASEAETADDAATGAGPAACPEVGRRRRWTGADDALLGRLWAEGFTANAISRRLQRSEASVATRASVLKLKRSADSPLIHGDETGRNSGGADRGRPAGTVVRLGLETAGSPAPEGGETNGAAGERRTATNGALDEAVSEDAIDTVVRFLRSRDYSVVRTDHGLFRLDEREELTTQELLSRANRVRAHLRQPPFPAMAS